MQLLKDVHLFEGNGISANSYLIKGKQLILIDTGTGDNASHLMNQISGAGFKLSDLDIIVNTHCHFDHIGGNDALLKESKAKLAAHEIDAVHIESADPDYTVSGIFPYTTLSPVKVDVKLTEGDNIGNFMVIHTPGHTEGSMSLYDENSKILVSGDLIFSDGNIGRVDLPGGNIQDMENSVKKVAGLDVKILLPGHGYPNLENSNDVIKKAVYVASSFI